MDYSLPTSTIPKDPSSISCWNEDLFLKTLRVGIDENGSDDDKSFFKWVTEGITAGNYWSGESTSRPLEGDRFVKIKEKFNTFKEEGISILGVMGIVSQTIAVANAYFNYLKRIVDLPNIELFPYQSIVTPIALFYLKAQSLPGQYSEWQNATDFEESHQKFFKLLSTLGSMSLYLLALVESTSLAIKTAVSVLTFYDILMSGHISQRDKDLENSIPQVIIAY